MSKQSTAASVNKEALLPMLFAAVSVVVFALLVSYDVLGRDYYKGFHDKIADPTFFDEKISSPRMYSVLIGVNILLGFFLTFYQSLIGSHKFDLLNGSNEDIAKKEIIKEYYGNRRWILVLATVSGEVWIRVSHALVLYLSFTDLYVLLGGLCGSLIASVGVVAWRYWNLGEDKDNRKTQAANVQARLSF